MGNNSSGHAINHAPPPWSQSLPRDMHRQKKYGAIQGTKVLPERIPGQRLRPTENGRNLQFQGTISPKRTEEVSGAPPGFPLGYQHSTSMTALNHHPAMPPLLHPEQSSSIHDFRFGLPPSKSFLSEPDLRGGPTHQVKPTGMASPIFPPHSVICESATKGRIKSKKRHKAPPPPPPLAFHLTDKDLERSVSVPSPFKESWSTATSSPRLKENSKPRKSGLFKKKNESRMSVYDQSDCSSNILGKGNQQVDRIAVHRDYSTPPVNLKKVSKRDLKERTRSLDNLQHEIGKSPPALNSSMHSLEIIGSHHLVDKNKWTHPDFGNRHGQYTIERETRRSSGEDSEGKISKTIERESRLHKNLSTIERQSEEKRLLESRMSCPVFDCERKISYPSDVKQPVNYRHSSSSSAAPHETPFGVGKDEWDKAEEEWINKKKKTEELQLEIVNVARNLKKTPTPYELGNAENILKKSTNIENEESATPPTAESQPKTFFFGMEPDTNADKIVTIKSSITKINEQDSVTIHNSRVEYSKHSLKPKPKTDNSERENWNRSLDHKDNIKNRSKENHSTDIYEDKRKLSRKIDEFVATIERSKSKLKPSPEDYNCNSLSRHGDGGYHSRQNSGSFHLDHDQLDDGNTIQMNLRPTLPRRQLELPRFSPNAAWRSLSVEANSKTKENHVDITNTDDCYMREDQIHRSTRPMAPPRGSGEKSADSGISGDAGSPGLQDFESLSPDKIKLLPGPLAASSPITSPQKEIRRAWTPAQDLDDNSLEESTGGNNHKTSFPQEVSTMPKLTIRTNMFSKLGNRNNSEDDISTEVTQVKTGKKSVAVGTDFVSENINDYTDSTQFRSLHRVKRSLSTPKNYEDPVIEDDDGVNCNEDSWRENWSMSRSIPNSLNNCEEADRGSNSSKPCRSRSESRMSGNMQNNGDNRSFAGNPRPITPSYMQRGNSGHIMYLPEYKSYSLGKIDSPTKKEHTKVYNTLNHSENYNGHSSSPEQERKPPSGDENPAEPKSDRMNMSVLGPTNSYPFIENANVAWKKQKKFSYQSTVRILEKKKLEEKLSIEAEAKEERRFREMEAMMKVEQEFQKKREREKKRLKKQLKLFQKQSIGAPIEHDLSSSSEDKHGSSQYSENLNSEHFEVTSQFSDRPPLPSSPPPSFSPRRSMSSYQSLPMEYPVVPLYETRGTSPPQAGIFSGLKKWVKGKKESKTPNGGGYHSDASSATITSGSARQDPEGAPASSPGRKPNGDFRAEIIAASRYRNGTIIHEQGAPAGTSDRRSPGISESSKSSHRRPFTPDSRRTISPDSSKKSYTSEPCQLTQELSEMKQEHRYHRQYRTPSRAQPNHAVPRAHHHKESPAVYDYRRAFYHAQLPNNPKMTGMNHMDECDRYSRTSNDSRISRKSAASSKKSSTADFFGPDYVPKMPFRRPPHHVDRRRSPPSAMSPFPPKYYQPEATIISIPGPKAFPKDFQNKQTTPARFAQNLITPFSPNRGYRPVVYNTTPHVNILRVT